MPSERNAHPLLDERKEVAVVHNGIIENATALRRMLEEHGHTFTSETDTEVLAHLIEAAFDGNLEDAVIDALHQVEGAYGIAVVSSRDPGKIVAARKGEPAAHRSRRRRGTMPSRAMRLPFWPTPVR